MRALRRAVKTGVVHQAWSESQWTGCWDTLLLQQMLDANENIVDDNFVLQ